MTRPTIKIDIDTSTGSLIRAKARMHCIMLTKDGLERKKRQSEREKLRTILNNPKKAEAIQQNEYLFNLAKSLTHKGPGAPQSTTKKHRDIVLPILCSIKAKIDNVAYTPTWENYCDDITRIKEPESDTIELTKPILINLAKQNRSDMTYFMSIFALTIEDLETV